MSKMIIKRLLIYMVAALCITIGGIFLLQTYVCKRNNSTDSAEKLEAVKDKLDDNEEQIARLTETLSQDNLAKARAFADMIKLDPEILTKEGELERIKERLVVNELHVIDEKGIITHITINDYIGFDMKSGEQSNAFMEIVENPSFELAQEPQENVADNIVMQYVGVARKDAPGFVQVGIRPDVFEKMLASTKMDKVIDGFDFGSTGYVFGIDKKTGEIVAHPNKDLIGKSAESIIKGAGSGYVTLNNEKGYYVAKEYNDILLGTFMPSKEYFSVRTNQTMVMSVSLFCIFTVLLLMINNMVQRKIVAGINHITTSVQTIAAGDYSVVVEEQGNTEFKQLSTNINSMVQSIRIGMDENKELLKKQHEDMENGLLLIENVKSVCGNLSKMSTETLTYADDIQNGAEEQNKTLIDLKQVMADLVEDLNSSVEAAAEVNITTENAVSEIRHTQRQVEELKVSMEKINAMSTAIETIIEEINSIAQQTNMLSLNASIEAARAGEMGKGFAVVATQVGELAARSAQAAKETGELIMNSINAVENGQKITQQTFETFSQVVQNIESANRSAGQIMGMTKENVQTVSVAVNQFEKISNVTHKNVDISHGSKLASSNMADVTGRLLELVE